MLQIDTLLIILYFCRDNAVKSQQLEGQAAEECRKNYFYVYTSLFLGSDHETKESFIERFTKKYNEKRSEFEDDIRKLLTTYIQTTDRNRDGAISRDEFRANSKAVGVGSFVEKFFSTLPLKEHENIPNEDFMKCFFEYYCNNDKTRVSQFERAVCNGFGMRDDM